MTELRIVKEALLKKKHKIQESVITEIGILGSYVRGDETPNSDVDILIELSRPAKLDLFDLITIEQDLAEELNTPVDLVLKSSLKPIIDHTVLSEVQYL